MRPRKIKWLIAVIVILIVACNITYHRSVLFRGILLLTKNYITYGNVFGFTFIKPEEARRMWGNTPFHAPTFKSHPDLRAAMVYDLVQNKRLMGIDYRRIPELLGHKDGDYYLSDEILTYRIYQLVEGVESKQQLTYDIVVSHRNDVVKDVLIWRTHPMLDENQFESLHALD